MCGIVGIINSKDLKLKAINVLSKLEYRGYDSAGVSFLAKIKLRQLLKLVKLLSFQNPLV